MAAGNGLPRPPLACRLTARQWLAIDVVVALACACWTVFGLRVHGRHAHLPAVPMALFGLAATLPVAVRRIGPVPVLAVVTVAISRLIALGRAHLNTDITLGMASYLVAVRCRRPAALAALGGTEVALICGVLAAAATAQLVVIAFQAGLVVAG